MTQLTLRKTSAQQANSERLFSGIWIHWQALTGPEQVVCANIVLLPLWWVSGLYQYWTPLAMAAIIAYEMLCYGKFRLKKIDFLSAALFAYSGYVFLGGLFNELASTNSLDPLSLVKSLIGFCYPSLTWYIQSNNFRVRPVVLIWACTVSAVEMLVCLLVFVLLGTPVYSPPNTLWGILRGARTYEEGASRFTHLIPYINHQLVFGSLPRFSLFFPGPIEMAQYCAFMSLLALDIRNRLWSQLLFSACILLVIVSATRSVWVMLPIVLLVRYLITIAKAWGRACLCGLLAIVSFLALSFPPITAQLHDNYLETTNTVGEYRADSTGERMAIYTQTLEQIPEKPIFGHVTTGDSVRSYGTDMKQARVSLGTHSFVLGLLYKRGTIGTGLFFAYWLGLFSWLYKSRSGRPLSCFLSLLLWSLIFPVAELSSTIQLCVLLSLVSRQPAQRSQKRRSLVCVSS
ncbi:MAG: O-antigen ligase family protein [Cyanophyceae cyanobacterium]